MKSLVDLEQSLCWDRRGKCKGQEGNCEEMRQVYRLYWEKDKRKKRLTKEEKT